MSDMRDLVPLTADRVDALVGSCAPCTYWIDAPGHGHAGDPVARRARLHSWITEVTDAWGPPGRVLLTDDPQQSDGHVLLAPAQYAAGLASFSTAPSDPATVMLLTVVLTPEAAAESPGARNGRLAASGRSAAARRAGTRIVRALGPSTLGKALVVAAVKDALSHQVRSIDAIGVHRPASRAIGRTPHACVLDVGTLESVGFTVVREHPVYPRLRLDLRRTLAIKDDAMELVNRALAKLQGSRAGVEGARVDPTARIDPTR